jgi:hypothetical protein
MGELFSGFSGRGVTIAVIDSGVNPAHPHVGGVEGGARISSDGMVTSDYLDYNGHGTAVAGAIREKAPDAVLYALKVFDRTLTTSIATIIEAIEWAVERRIRVINLSLGTTNAGHREAFERVLERVTQEKIILVAASTMSGEICLPGSLARACGVECDWEIARDRFDVKRDGGEMVFVASAYPREIPGVPRERNLKGISFAVANMTGFVARALEAHPKAPLASLKQLLAAAARQPQRHEDPQSE